ncbi:MAG: DUF4396 domain-containing protein [Candidatus Saccharimonadales bacterium]
MSASPLTKMSASATVHCLTGCAIGELLGLLIGTHYGWGNAQTTLLAVALAFVSGYSFSTLPLVRRGLPFGSALKLVVVADTLSIATMEAVDNLLMWLIPGAMNAHYFDWFFWWSLALSLAGAFLVAWPVNYLLLKRGQGHALTHHYMHKQHHTERHDHQSGHQHADG